MMNEGMPESKYIDSERQHKLDIELYILWHKSQHGDSESLEALVEWGDIWIEKISKLLEGFNLKELAFQFMLLYSLCENRDAMLTVQTRRMLQVINRMAKESQEEKDGPQTN